MGEGARHSGAAHRPPCRRPGRNLHHAAGARRRRQGSRRHAPVDGGPGR